MRRQCRYPLAVALLAANIIPASIYARADDCRVGIIETVAGDGWADENGFGRYTGDGGPATQASLNWPSGLVKAADGSLYIADEQNDCVRRLDPAGTMETVAGWGRRGCSGDGGLATRTRLYAEDVAVAPDGSLYIADRRNHRIAKMDAEGVVTTVAGTCGDGYSTFGYSGDGGPATQAKLHHPSSIALGPDGSLYIADRANQRIRKVDTDGIITTVAGNGEQGDSGDGGPATEARLDWPGSELAVGADGSIYIADMRHHRIRRVDPAGIITTVVGNGHKGYSGDGGPAAQASLNVPSGVAVGADGSLYIADVWNHRIRKVSPLNGRIEPASTITTVAGSGTAGLSGDGGPATQASLHGPQGVTVGGDGSVYIADSRNHRIRKVDRDGIITTVAGEGSQNESVLGRDAGDGGPAMQASLSRPPDLAVGADGSLYIVGAFYTVRKVDRAGVITTVAGISAEACAQQPVLATEASLSRPHGVAVAPDGAIYIANTDDHRIAKVHRAGLIATIAGACERAHSPGGYAGDGRPAVLALLDQPMGVTVGPDGSLYIADTLSHRVRRIGPDGVITTVAGDGYRTAVGDGRYHGDGGPATHASFDRPWAVAVGEDGSLYIPDSGTDRVRKVDPAGVITTLVGSGEEGYSGDGGPAAEARLRAPHNVILAPDGSLYIADFGNHRVRRVGPNGIITTVAGNGWEDEEGRGYFSGDGGRATDASLNRPVGLALDADGSLYIADSGNHRIRKIRWLPCEPEAAKAAADELRAKASDSLAAWRETVELYLIATAWDDALAAADGLLALTPETDEPARMRAQILAARVYAAKRDDHEARRRLIRILAQAEQPTVLRDAADALVNLYLVREEREQAIATLNDLRLRTQDRALQRWVDDQLRAVAGD